MYTYENVFLIIVIVVFKDSYGSFIHKNSCKHSLKYFKLIKKTLQNGVFGFLKFYLQLFLCHLSILLYVRINDRLFLQIIDIPRPFFKHTRC